jgi:Uma2 family endonuclease
MASRPSIQKRVEGPPLPYVPARRFNDRDFARYCKAHPDFRVELSALGELVVMAPAGADSSARNLALAGQVRTWAMACGLGIAFESSAGFRLPNGAIRSPDASWLATERWNALTASEKRGFAPVCPDFVAELRSPSDTLRDLRAKMREYCAQGARLGWLIDPYRKVVEVYRPARRVRTMRSPRSLSGEDVLPGFVLDVTQILFD